MPDVPTQRCPYCAEEIRGEAVKCRFCGSMLGGHALTRTWYRSREHRKIAGVCAGLAEEFGISVTVVRLAFLLGTFIGGGMGVIIYLVLWVVMPYRPTGLQLPDARRSPPAMVVPPGRPPSA
jgi:phage shock protein PspC (stress-responsive transcriptional regulator)